MWSGGDGVLFGGDVIGGIDSGVGVGESDGDGIVVKGFIGRVWY